MKKIIWHNEQVIRNAVANSSCYADTIRALGFKAVTSQSTLKKYITKYGISTEHFVKNYDRMIAVNKLKETPLNEILEGKHPKYNRGSLKKRLLAEGIMQNICSECNQDGIWNNKPLKMQLDHINGVNDDHTLSNLRLICPNCHTQTPTFAGRNQPRAGTGKYQPKHTSQEAYFEYMRAEYAQNQQHYINKVLESDIDFTKYGWVDKVSSLIHQRPQKVNIWMKKIMPEFYKTCYKRKLRHSSSVV